MTFSRQCTLEKPTGKGGVYRQVSWIPESFVKLGKYLKLREDDVWEDGWQIVSIGGRKSREDLIERHNDVKNHRKGSDMMRGTRIALNS